MSIRWGAAGAVAVVAVILWVLWPESGGQGDESALESADQQLWNEGAGEIGATQETKRSRSAVAAIESGGDALHPSSAESELIVFRGHVRVPGALDPASLFVSVLRLDLPEAEHLAFELGRLETWADLRWMRLEASAMTDEDGSFELRLRDAPRREHRHRRYVLAVASTDHEGYPKLNNDPYVTPLGTAWGEDARPGAVHDEIVMECAAPWVVTLQVDTDPRMEWTKQGMHLDLNLFSSATDLEPRPAYGGDSADWTTNSISEEGVCYSISPLGGLVGARAQLKAIQPGGSYKASYTQLPSTATVSRVDDSPTIRVTMPSVAWVYLDIPTQIPPRREYEEGDDIFGHRIDYPQSIDLSYERLDRPTDLGTLPSEQYPSSAISVGSTGLFTQPTADHPELAFRNLPARLFHEEDRTFASIGWMEAGTWRISATLSSNEVWASAPVQVLPGAVTRVQLEEIEASLRSASLTLPARYLQDDCQFGVVSLDSSGRMNFDADLVEASARNGLAASGSLSIRIPHGLTGIAVYAAFDNTVCIHEYRIPLDAATSHFTVELPNSGISIPALNGVEEHADEAELVRLDDQGRTTQWSLPLVLENNRPHEVRGLASGTYKLFTWVYDEDYETLQRFTKRFEVP